MDSAITSSLHNYMYLGDVGHKTLHRLLPIIIHDGELWPKVTEHRGENASHTAAYKLSTGQQQQNPKDENISYTDWWRLCSAKVVYSLLQFKTSVSQHHTLREVDNPSIPSPNRAQIAL